MFRLGPALRTKSAGTRVSVPVAGGRATEMPPFTSWCEKPASDRLGWRRVSYPNHLLVVTRDALSYRNSVARPDLHDRATRPELTLGGRFARDVTSRYPFGSVWVTRVHRSGGRPPVPGSRSDVNQVQLGSFLRRRQPG